MMRCPSESSYEQMKGGFLFRTWSKHSNALSVSVARGKQAWPYEVPNTYEYSTTEHLALSSSFISFNTFTRPPFIFISY